MSVNENKRILDTIAKNVAEEFDNNLAKAFVMTAGHTLLENGIKLWYIQQPIDTKVEETEFGTLYKNTYSIMFDGIDTSEHDAKVRVDERANVIDLIDRHLWNYSKEVWTVFQSVLEQLKEKNMENEFFNFDEVVEIEKKKSYNQALEDFIHAYSEYTENKYGRFADDEITDMLKI